MSGSYNFLADSFHWSPIFINGSTRLFKKVSANFSATFQPYASDGKRYINTLLFTQDPLRPLTMSNVNVAMNTGFSAEEFRKGKQNDSDQQVFRPDWNVNLQYVYGISNGPDRVKYINHTLQASGELQVTPTWKMVLNMAYDLKNQTLVNSSIDFKKDLHCWEMEFNWVPVGLYKRYLFTLRIKSPVLRDVKVNRRRDFY